MKVKVDTAGQYKLSIDFTNGSGEERSLAVSAGLDTAITKFKATSAWTVWDSAEVLINLAAGENAVKFATVGGNDGPNIDQFDVTLVKAAARSDTTAKDTTARDTTAKDSSKTNIVKSLSMMAPKTYRVSLFDTKGALVRRLKVESAKIGDVAWLTRGLPAGIYVMRMTAPGVDRRKFIAVK